MTSSYQSKQAYGTTHRPAALLVAGLSLIIVGIMGFVDSYLILASVIVWGWLIVGLIGLGTFICGIALIQGADWAYDAGISLASLNLFVGFIELIGAFNVHYQILGWVGIGQGVGAATLLFSAIALGLMYTKGAREYVGN